MNRFIFYKSPFDLEQSIMAAWGTKEDLERVIAQYFDGVKPMTVDDLWNKLSAVANIHESRCQELFDVFEGFLKRVNDEKKGLDTTTKSGAYESDCYNKEAWDKIMDRGEKKEEPVISDTVNVSGVPYKVEITENMLDKVSALEARVKGLEQALKDTVEEAARIAETGGTGPVVGVSGSDYRQKIARQIRDLGDK